jgi:RNA polymerase sigma factor (sigma-70 family)
VDTVDALAGALARLPHQQRAVVVLRYYEQLSEQETAAALGCSVGTVKSRGSRALAALRADGLLSEASTAEDGRR